MCKCNTKPDDFNYLLRLAKKKESDSRKKYGVYLIKNPVTKKAVGFISSVSQIKKDSNICCYYDSDGNNVDIVRPKKKQKPKKIDKNVQKPDDSQV